MKKGKPMSRTCEALKEAEERQKKGVVTVAPLPAVPAVEWQDELEKFRNAVAANGKPSVLGRILRFKKGDWILGQEKEKIPNGTRFIAVMNECFHGWIKWDEVLTDDGDRKKVPVHLVGKIVEGFKPPPREELDCLDPSEWKIGLNGKREDPWKEVIYLPLLSLNGEQVMTFSSDTPTGRPRVWKLIDSYAWIGKRHPGQYPIVELQAGGYEDKRYGWVDTPGFKIVGWTGRPDPALLLGHAAGGDSDDTTVAAEHAGDPVREDQIVFPD
jgi:hypothetical protein